ncbi:heterokaryon incompatibility protein-domain-containing protein [Phascolomyces articulosus]|uniref:Heterokaryon incompatibility protein-domain-containing protein n=1 Tax=Phascolomyces articulosus TaxID=60185 RepID=A0AAD5PGF4_9FUNG|nr:heterokaryon incompatibility protein-domain-containing protein [Phascolomyces articulosus]
MYIEYSSRQWTIRPNKKPLQVFRYRSPPVKVPNALPRPKFMPSKLVRIEDMRIVPGSQVKEGYCAISYSWNQSGDYVVDPKTKKHIRNDQGKHKVYLEPWSIMTTFEGVIRKICQDFNIKYIWYDQMCINQEDLVEKHREIHHMHQIYSNAYCTVALVPEFQMKEVDLSKIERQTPIEQQADELFSLFLSAKEIIPTSHWSLRLWTLEEAIKSQRLLFVGQNTHLWTDTEYHTAYINMLTRPIEDWNVASVLHFAHLRSSTNAHDRVFALANIFPGIINRININYTQPLEDLMILFYGLLAQGDLSILCFGGYNRYKSIGRVKPHRIATTTMMEHYIPILKFKNLPSWTGVSGEHKMNPSEGSMVTAFKNYRVHGRIMQLTCAGITNFPSLIYAPNGSLSVGYDELPPFPKYYNNEDWYIRVPIQFPGQSECKYIYLADARGIGENSYRLRFMVSKWFQLLSLFFNIQKKDLQWHKYPGIHDFITIHFDLTENIVGIRTHCVILFDIVFKKKNSRWPHLTCPVIKRNGKNHYKAIGTCNIRNRDDLFSGCTLPEQTFLIE